MIEALALVMQIGIVMLVSIFIGTFAALWIGERLGIRWLAVVGFFVGAVAGGQSVYRLVEKYLKKNDKGV